MMRIKVRVQPKSSREEVVKNPDGSLKVYLTSPPVNGKANKDLIEAISEHFNVRKSSVRIVRGEKSREKLIEIIQGD